MLIAGEVVVGAREMRTMGIEAAYAVRESSLDAPPARYRAELRADRAPGWPDPGAGEPAHTARVMLVSV